MCRLTILLASEFLEAHAEQLGVVEPDRNLQILAFVWAFVFGFAADENRTRAGVRRCYNLTADETISLGGFYQWLMPRLREYLFHLVEHGVNKVDVPSANDADIDRPRCVMIAD